MSVSMVLARTVLLGGAIAGLGSLVLILFASGFAAGATWSPVTQSGGPGFVFVIAPALGGWLGIAPNVQRRGLAAFGEALWLSGLAAVVVGGVGFALARSWPAHPAVLESLFSTTTVALVVSTIASVAVRLVNELNPE